MRDHQTSANIAWLIAAACISTMAVGLIYSYIMINEPTPIHDQRRALVSGIVPRGGYLIIHNAFTVEKRCAGFFSRNIYDHSGTRIVSESEFRPAIASPVGQQFQSTRSLRIPDDAALGPARYISIIEWSCNPWQRIWPSVEELPELEFMIIGWPDRRHD